ncbi:type I-C CRISPR-associated protein Cas8c/Csd1 [Paracoccus shanxieyensis]|uniref:Type I-C CRISPR-associated protein Cas8c/Csd1 n=1 Tax=Paracoccus shanxieyensis TaxID=2675752 RepID=A0A6L6J4C6_9RHOB|nr:type I-C CRISPR-associated protein Cas8c/Csd1 [Paracoccus shanxieyensis]MTH65597.1 type I-C CRISPR-associated protein Cas8c/Csd1 [Paracoccus shanxieyensis]MTH88828.1 type I-C CRISPR-associated protein Cas8c/Csd1 [Paracoccus shanxieyensis]
MSMLASLVRAYDRLPDAPPFGFSTEKIGFCVLLNADGSVASVEDLRGDDRKRSPRMLLVPQAVKRTAGISPNFLWDKSAYVLGVTAGDGKRTAEEHAAFRARHAEWLAQTDDPGLLAFLRFLDGWTPDAFAAPVWHDEMRDQNIVFALADEYRQGYLHDRPAAREFWRQIGAEGASDPQICLVTGDSGPVTRLHPSIKGVWGAQSSGASLVSFNLDAFTSYGHEQGDNAPVSEAAAFAYGAVLNRYLDKDSGHRIQIGDASTVFWADCQDMKLAEEAEWCFAALLDPASENAQAVDEERLNVAKLHSRLEAIRNGQRLSQVTPELAEGVRFHVLGLAPNAARLSVRFYWQDDFGRLTENFQRYLDDTAIDPPPRDGWPALWRYLLELASQGKRENVPPLIAGEWLRAILAGAPYPLTLLSTALMRIRADGEINALRCAMLKSVLIRNLKMEAPVALDPANTNKGYVLGRLFAVYEEVQRAALGGINASIKDKFYGAASASPQKVFRTLDSGSANHFGKLRKISPGRAVNLEKLLTSITDLMDPAGDPIPASLNAAEQALFGIGYYHQRSDFFRKQDDKTTEGSK